MAAIENGGNGACLTVAFVGILDGEKPGDCRMLSGKAAVMAAVASCALLWNGSAPAADPAISPDKEVTSRTPAQLFGGRELIRGIHLSPDGNNAVFVAPGPGMLTYVAVMDVETRKIHLAGSVDGKPLRLQSCGWASNTRIVCQQFGVAFDRDPPIPYTRTIAVDSDGKNPVYIGRRVAIEASRILQFDGKIIDWMAGDGTILMTRDYIPSATAMGQPDTGDDGLGVDRVDTRTGRGTRVERANNSAADYMSDGQGNIRIRETDERDADGSLTGVITYLYRQAGDSQWRTFSKTKPGTNEFTPVAVDGTRNVAYA